ncbi:uncharacterized protein BO97DRAFT_416185 [Aspergillus homomorphus CBS 101889]|uniref:Uncharacterized protein n=1 Tax=Aspergillus homomorphus (strain CBS 101889) TaxID=1450537 RepID=A0A395HRW0_ASPHC|nr:hypothetical protein BO97DRAFT_416185 [Aspergillus homomorphus CBS 101889]RAL10153.1 hypothetical protein BO97DRAFT_416185 [Aspergillus homomorphus CBS 101889]
MFSGVLGQCPFKTLTRTFDKPVPPTYNDENGGSMVIDSMLLQPTLPLPSLPLRLMPQSVDAVRNPSLDLHQEIDEPGIVAVKLVRNRSEFPHLRKYRVSELADADEVARHSPKLMLYLCQRASLAQTGAGSARLHCAHIACRSYAVARTCESGAMSSAQ